MPASFSDRLAGALQRTGTPVLVGLDPRWEQLPASLRSGRDAANPAEQAAAYLEFCQAVIDAVAGLAPAVKPQAAFFEELGPAGMQTLAEVVAYAHARGLVVVLDGKRNDIGSTATAYAHGYLAAGPGRTWQADALTVSPYLGDDSLTPFVDVCREHAAGIFVLVKTSNPGGGMLQDLVAAGRPIYRHVAEYVERLSAADLGGCGYGSIGAVVGATYPQQLTELRATMPSTWLLIPGFGSQGGTAADVADAFDDRGLGAIVNNSRGIIFAHAQKRYAQFGESRWQAAVEQATRDMIDVLASETRAGRLRRGGAGSASTVGVERSP